MFNLKITLKHLVVLALAISLCCTAGQTIKITGTTSGIDLPVEIACFDALQVLISTEVMNQTTPQPQEDSNKAGPSTGPEEALDPTQLGKQNGKKKEQIFLNEWIALVDPCSKTLSKFILEVVQDPISSTEDKNNDNIPESEEPTSSVTAVPDLSTKISEISGNCRDVVVKYQMVRAAIENLCKDSKTEPFATFIKDIDPKFDTYILEDNIKTADDLKPFRLLVDKFSTFLKSWASEGSELLFNSQKNVDIVTVRNDLASGPVSNSKEGISCNFVFTSNVGGIGAGKKNQIIFLKTPVNQAEQLDKLGCLEQCDMDPQSESQSQSQSQLLDWCFKVDTDKFPNFEEAFNFIAQNGVSSCEIAIVGNSLVLNLEITEAEMSSKDSNLVLI